MEAFWSKFQVSKVVWKWPDTRSRYISSNRYELEHIYGELGSLSIYLKIPTSPWIAFLQIYLSKLDQLKHNMKTSTLQLTR